MTDEERKLAEWHLPRYNDYMRPENERRDCETDVAAVRVLLGDFETHHSLDELNAIVDLRPENVQQYPLRESAKKALEPIVALLNILEEQTNISKERYAELKAAYRRLQNAVGMINNNRVRHS